MSIKAISPLDGRYKDQLEQLQNYFSEWALLKYRVMVEVEWLIHLVNERIIENKLFQNEEIQFLRAIYENFDENDALRIKEIERGTKHDVKAVEYFVKSKLEQTSLAAIKEFVHFACTSEDINNIAHALMLKNGITNVWTTVASQMVAKVAEMAEITKDIAMLSHTHGQHATPTTLGKELAVFVYRWQRQFEQIQGLQFLGKLNGAVGNYNAHVSAYPEIQWEEVSKKFIQGMGISFNPLTTQIESHDYMAECFQAIMRFNNITLDFDRDVWSYISLGYFKQVVVEGEVGSSTMPHKVNPINFENSEANLGVSNAVLDYLANKLPISRLQRDLSDSSSIRNIGVGIAHSYIALLSTIKGLKELSVNEQVINEQLSNSWEVLGEAIQTVMRINGYDNPYDKLKELTRGQVISEKTIKDFIINLELNPNDKQRLLSMTPNNYTGIATDLVKHIHSQKQS